MVRQRNGFNQVGNQTAAAMAGIDPTVLIEAMKSGQDVGEIVSQLQQQQTRDKALDSFGILTVRLVRNMPIKHSQTTGRWYALGTLMNAKGVKVQGGRTLTEKHIQKLGQLEIDLGLSESLKEQIEDFRAENGGNHYFELVLDGESQVTQLQARYPKGHELGGKNIFLISEDDDATNPRNWTPNDTGLPLMKMQLRCYATGYLSAGQASIPSMELPEDEDEFEAMLDKASKVSSVLSARGLDQWRKDREAKRVADAANTEASLQISDKD